GIVPGESLMNLLNKLRDGKTDRLLVVCRWMGCGKIWFWNSASVEAMCRHMRTKHGVHELDRRPIGKFRFKKSEETKLDKASCSDGLIKKVGLCTLSYGSPLTQNIAGRRSMGIKARHWPACLEVLQRGARRSRRTTDSM